MFPDPWPKRRHAPRRLITENFLVGLHRALVPNGAVRIATDDREYFRHIKGLVSYSPLFATLHEAASTPVISKFEKQFVENGIEIHRLLLRKVSPVR